MYQHPHIQETCHIYHSCHILDSSYTYWTSLFSHETFFLILFSSFFLQLPGCAACCFNAAGHVGRCPPVERYFRSMFSLVRQALITCGCSWGSVHCWRGESKPVFLGRVSLSFSPFPSLCELCKGLDWNTLCWWRGSAFCTLQFRRQNKTEQESGISYKNGKGRWNFPKQCKMFHSSTVMGIKWQRKK